MTELEKELQFGKEMFDALQAENARLRKALEFYADEDNYIEGREYVPVVVDYGNNARAALKGEG